MANYEQANYIFSANGVVIPDTADIQSTVQAEFQEALGSDLSLEESTPQGRLIDIETTARINTLGFNATLANVIVNIMYSAGPALDAWGANYGIPRNGATYSQVTAIVTGVPDTVITPGSQAQDVNGILWQAESDIVISGGTATGTFICTQPGAISLGIGELTNIVASGTLGIDGWETITNNVAAVLGAAEESDTNYRGRILTGIFTGTALFGNYKSAVLKVDNVIDCYTMDNPYGTALILDDITIPAHSVYACVQGGNSYDVAYALYSVKSAGCGWAGDTTVTVTDETYGTSNTVKYQIPTESNFKISVSVTANANTSSDLTLDIKNTIINYFAGAYENYPKPTIRGTLNPFEIATILKSQINGITVNDIQIGLVTAKNHAVADFIKASAIDGITWVSVDDTTFASEVSNTNGNYVFSYNGSNWNLEGSIVNLANYGITITGTPITDDVITVLFSNGSLSTSPIRIYASEVPTISESNITVTING